MSLSLGGDGPAFGVSYFNPLTGKYDSPFRYKQHLHTGTRESNWLPPGLTMANVKAGETEGYQCRIAGGGVPGWVWVKV